MVAPFLPQMLVGRVNNQDSRNMRTLSEKEKTVPTMEASSNSSLLHNSHVQDSISAGSTIAPQEPAYVER